jgi:hypothetical protein
LVQCYVIVNITLPNINMRVLLFSISLFFSIVVFATEPTEPNAPTLNFGRSEYTKALSYFNNAAFLSLANDKFEKHFAVLANRKLKYKKEEKFVEYSFYYIHKKLLKKYEQYVSISETMSNGTYDCVTASAVYALFLTELDIPFSVIETNYHMYILVYPNTENEILLETTNPLSGFNSDMQNIALLKQQYLQDNKAKDANQATFNWNINRALTGNEMIGVLLYNQSIKQFNLGDKSAAKQLAKEAIQYYNSSRINSYLHFLNGSQIASK